MILVPIYRAVDHGGGKRSYLYSFSPIETDPFRGIVGSGCDPWKVAQVPYRSVLSLDPATGVEGLVLPNETGWLCPEEVAERYAPEGEARPPG